MGAASRGDDRFGVTIGGGTGPPRRRTFLLTYSKTLPRIHLWYDRTSDRGIYQQRQSGILWRSVSSGAEEIVTRTKAASKCKEGTEMTPKHRAPLAALLQIILLESRGAATCEYPSRAVHGGFVHARCVLDRVDRIARGHVDPRFWVVCPSAWPEGSRPTRRVELARGLPMSEQEEGGRW